VGPPLPSYTARTRPSKRAGLHFRGGAEKWGFLLKKNIKPKTDLFSMVGAEACPALFEERRFFESGLGASSTRKHFRVSRTPKNAMSPGKGGDLPAILTPPMEAPFVVLWPRRQGLNEKTHQTRTGVRSEEKEQKFSAARTRSQTAKLGRLSIDM